MKKYTIDDLKSFERDERGYLICPTGDYTAIKEFDKYYKFGKNSEFGNFCEFGRGAEFGDFCKFGVFCEFSKLSKFGEFCEFGDNCIFGDDCEIGFFCKFGKNCIFGAGCEFLGGSKFGNFCEFGRRCNLEGHFFENLETPAVKVVKIGYIGRRNDSTYFFQTAQGIYVRCGCFFGSLKEFEAQVKETHKDNKQYLAEYLGAIKYIKSIMPIGDESNGN